jgi:glycosyltransferase involved in cell wall biosynthesis
VFFTLRRLVARMGLDTLLLATARVRDGGGKFRLMIGGDGPLRTFLKQTATTLGLDNHVHLANCREIRHNRFRNIHRS